MLATLFSIAISITGPAPLMAAEVTTQDNREFLLAQHIRPTDAEGRGTLRAQLNNRRSAPRATKPIRRVRPPRMPARQRYDGYGHRPYTHPRYRGPRYGTVVPVPPRRRQRYVHDGLTFYFSGNVWYRPHRSGFLIVAPPIGLIVPFLPHTYSRLVIDNRIYYLVDDVYYERVPRGYTIVPPPMWPAPVKSSELDASPDMPVLRVTAREGQSERDRTSDKLACHIDAVNQTGYNPAVRGGGVSQTSYLERKHDYRRAISACLDELGYTVQ